MTWFAAPLLLALAVASVQTPLPRMTHAEGRVVADRSGVRTSGGRAEVLLGNGSIVHLDAGTAVRFGEPALTMEDGRVVIRAADVPLQIATPFATLYAGPGSVCTLSVDAAGGRLLVNVAAGEATLQTRYAHATRVMAGQSALMTSPTAVPWAAAYTHAALDRFAIWSDARAAASGASNPAGDWAASGLSSATLPSTSPCTGWPSWTAPCWVLPAPQPTPSYAPTYAPNYAPNYTPNFNVAPDQPAQPPGGGTPEHRPRRHQPPTTPEATPPAPQAPPPAVAQEGPRGRSGAIKKPPTQ